ncbi:MAG: GNAT family N-acetyltransferase [Oscillospiraceae bacterium]|nr:GNAT family N-acetyltransferase [Oscillospiraceae bacterium]
MDNTKLNAALDYLTQNPVAHMDMIVPIRRGTADILYSNELGVCLIETISGSYMTSASNAEIAIKLLKLLPDEGLFVFHQEFILDAAKSKLNYGTFLENYQAVYLGRDPLPVSEIISIRPLDESYFDTVCVNYGADVGNEYIHKLIKSGEIFGGFAGSDLAGFAGIHEEGSIGLLNVLDEHQNKGYGKALVSHMTNHQLAKGIVPFAQIDKSNEPSLAVFKNSGFSISEELLYWLF